MHWPRREKFLARKGLLDMTRAWQRRAKQARHDVTPKADMFYRPLQGGVSGDAIPLLE
jgi:hypothetical protein